ncbi:hypothetical protein ABT093_09540 [Kitasatospora sp. NPDC002551]|uniref:hypothetical protein n=1 Tax=Kitasatospora sp. NPDC002551 TaxID=3154539 RepID=UPI003333A520
MPTRGDRNGVHMAAHPPRSPGWSLDRPFDLAVAVADLQVAAAIVADLTRAGDDAVALADARLAVAQISARITRHVQPEVES